MNVKGTSFARPLCGLFTLRFLHRARSILHRGAGVLKLSVVRRSRGWRRPVRLTRRQRIQRLGLLVPLPETLQTRLPLADTKDLLQFRYGQLVNSSSIFHPYSSDATVVLSALP
jgi:hypothetical protein